MSEGALTGLIILAAGIIFPLFWLLVVGLLSVLSGWVKLSRHYAFKGQVPQPLLPAKYLSMGYTRIFMVHYKGIVSFSKDDTYLYISVMWFFRLGNKPLRIPLADIQVLDAKTLFVKAKCLVTKKVPGVKILVNPVVANAIKEG